MIEQMKIVFSGTLLECFMHFGVALKEKVHKNESVKFRKFIMDFIVASDDSFFDWLNGKHEPVGEKKLRSFVALKLIGYDVEEYEKIHHSIRAFGELVVYKTFTLAEVTNLLGFTNQSTMLAVLLGKTETSEEKKQMMWDVCKSRREETELKKGRIFPRFSKYQNLVDEKNIPVVDSEKLPKNEVDHNEDTLCRSLLTILKETSECFVNTGCLEQIEKNPRILEEFNSSEILQIASIWNHLGGLLLREGGVK